MQAPYFDYTRQDERIAKNNLQKIIDDPYGFGETNAGWCYLLAPLRTFLTDPRFISLIRQYKQKYYKNGRLQNEDFICAMYGKQNIQELSKDRNNMENINFQNRGDRKNYDIYTYTSADVYDTLKAICELTDNNGEMRRQLNQSYSFYKGKKKHTVRSPYIGFIKLAHQLRPDGLYRDVSIMSDILAECTAIMSESNKVLSLGPNNGIYGNGIGIDDYNYTFANLNALEAELDKERLITVCASENHDFNIYKSLGYYYITGGGQINNNGKLKRFSTLKGAIRGVWNSTGTNLNNYHQCFIVEERYISNDKQYRIQRYNIEKKNRLNRTLYYKQQMQNTIDNYNLLLRYYDNEIRNLQARIKDNQILFQQELGKLNSINRNYNLFNKYNKYNYYNQYNNFNFYNKRQEQNRIQREMDRLNRNIQYLEKQIDIVNMNKKNSLLQRMDRMKAIWKNSNYDNEVFKLYSDFKREHSINNYNGQIFNLNYAFNQNNKIK